MRRFYSIFTGSGRGSFLSGEKTYAAGEVKFLLGSWEFGVWCAKSIGKFSIFRVWNTLFCIRKQITKNNGSLFDLGALVFLTFYFTPRLTNEA